MCKQRCAEDERARIVICRMKTVNENEKKGWKFGLFAYVQKNIRHVVKKYKALILK